MHRSFFNQERVKDATLYEGGNGDKGTRCVRIILTTDKGQKLDVGK